MVSVYLPSDASHNTYHLTSVLLTLDMGYLFPMPCGATQDRRVMVERSDRMWSTGEGSGKPLQYSCIEYPIKNMKREKDRTLKDELSRLVGAQYATGEQWRNNSRKNEETEPKLKQCAVVDVTGDGSKV